VKRDCLKARRVPANREELPDQRVAKHAALAWGVLSIDELVACGLSLGGIKSRVARGHLHRKYRGVYAVGHPKLPLEGCFLAAVKACGKAARLSHFAAAALYGFVEWDFRDPEVTVVGRGTRSHPGIRIHQTSSFDGADLRMQKGIPVTSPARTLVDLASIRGYPSLRRAVRQALSLNKVTLRELVATLHRLVGRRGTRELAEILVRAVPTRSEFEDIVHDLILSGGFSEPDVNVPLSVEGTEVVPDFRWPDARVIVEADSRRWHDNPVARADDAERRTLLEAFRETVVSVTYRQAVVTPRHTLDRIRDAGAPLAARVTSSGS
jgi:hypothetical protein